MNLSRFEKLYSASKEAQEILKREFDDKFPSSVEEANNQPDFVSRTFWRLLQENPELLKGNEKKLIKFVRSLAEQGPTFNKRYNARIYEILSSDRMVWYFRTVPLANIQSELAFALRAMLKCSFLGFTSCNSSYKFFHEFVPHNLNRFPYVIRILFQTLGEELSGRDRSFKRHRALFEQYRELNQNRL